MKRNIAFTGLIAAIYTVLCLVLSAFSFGTIQIRISDSLYQLLPHNKKYGMGLILGTIIVNSFSPLGIIDVFFGTIGTIVGVALSNLINPKLDKMWQKRICTLICACLGMPFVAYELNIIYDVPFVIAALSVIGGMLISQIIGIILFENISRKIKLDDI